MPKLNQKGFTHLLLILVLLVGIAVGVYLVLHPQIFKSKASSVDGSIAFIDDLKRPIKENTAETIFVYFKITPPKWAAQTSFLEKLNLIGKAYAANQNPVGNTDTGSSPDIDPSSYQYTTFLRVSLDQSKMDINSPCEFTGDPLTNCQEITLDNPINEVNTAWVLPKQEGTYPVYVRFFSNKGNSKDLSESIAFHDTDPHFFDNVTLIGGQIAATSVIEVLRKAPGTAAFNAVAVFLTSVHSANEQLITLSQAKQLGFDFSLTYREDGIVEFDFNQDQLQKLGLTLDSFPDPDPITGEVRLQILPKANPDAVTEGFENGLNIVLGEAGGRIIGKLFNVGLLKATQSNTLQRIGTNVKANITSLNNQIKQKVVNRFIAKKISNPSKTKIQTDLLSQGYPSNQSDDAAAEIRAKFWKVTPKQRTDMPEEFIKNTQNKRLTQEEIKEALSQQGYSTGQLTDDFLRQVQLRIKNAGENIVLTDEEFNALIKTNISNEGVSHPVASKISNPQIGEFLSEGSLGLAYKKGDKLYKVMKYQGGEFEGTMMGDQSHNFNQIEALMDANGQAGLPQFYGLVLNSKGEIIGYAQEFITGETLLKYAKEGNKTTLDQIKGAVSNLIEAHRLTGIPHDDLLNPANIIVQNKEGVVSFKFIDYGFLAGKDLSDSAMKGQMGRDVLYLIKTLTRPEVAEGEYVVMLDVDNTYKQALEDYFKSILESIYSSDVADSLTQRLMKSVGF